jgi:hypothetical protein
MRMMPLNAIWIIATTTLATVFALAGIAIAADAVRSWHRALGTTTLVLAAAKHSNRTRAVPAGVGLSRGVPGAIRLTARLTARRAARRSHGLGGAGPDGFAY